MFSILVCHVRKTTFKYCGAVFQNGFSPLFLEFELRDLEIEIDGKMSFMYLSPCRINFDDLILCFLVLILQRQRSGTTLISLTLIRKSS